MKKRTTIYLDETVRDNARREGINISEATEEALGFGLTHTDKKGKKLEMNGEGKYIINDIVGVRIEEFYKEYKEYASGLQLEYNSKYAVNWITLRALEIGIEVHELLAIFEERYIKEEKNKEKQPKLGYSEEDYKETVDKIFESYKAFRQKVTNDWKAKNNRYPVTSRVSFAEEMSTRGLKWCEARRKSFIGNVSAREVLELMEEKIKWCVIL